MTAPQQCDPATLIGDCPDCGRGMHLRVGHYGSRAQCHRGHVVRDTRGLCNACGTRARRREKGVTPRRRAETPVTPAGHSYCPHDEGEPCDCAVAS